MSQALAVILWFTAVVMLVVVPIEHRRMARWGEGATAVRATVLEHGQGVSRPWPPGSYWTSVKVEWTGHDGVVRQKWLYDLDPDIPAVGSSLRLVHPPQQPEALGREISAAVRWQASLRFVAWSLLVAALGAMAWLGTTGPAWVRYSPRLALCVGLLLLGLSLVSVTVWDRYAHLYRFQAVEGTVTAAVAGANRRIAGVMRPTWDVVVRYPAQGADYETIWRGVPDPPAVGASLLVRYDPARPDFGVLEAPQLHRWGVGIGGVMALLGLLGAAWSCVSWYRAD